MLIRRLFAAVFILLMAVETSAQMALVPEQILLNESVREAIDAPWLTDEERSALRVFHGVWEDSDLVTPALRAQAALLEWRLHDAAFEDPAMPATIRSQALLRIGEAEQALQLLHDDRSFAAARLRTEAMEMLGRLDAAINAASEPVAVLRDRRVDDAAELTDAVRAMILRSKLEGQPARDYQFMITLLAQAHQTLDRLYWPARLAEARLLADKDSATEAIMTLHETLALNPRSSEAWYELGRLALQRFDFDGATLAADHLWTINPEHPLAILLMTELRLVQDDPDGALELLTPLRERWPNMRQAIAFEAATHALFYDNDAMHAALAEHDRLSPNGADAHFLVGRHLSLNRQYDLAAEILSEAIRRRPAWPAPQIELGLMELQSGRDAVALSTLREVTVLDPFNKRAANSLFLLEALAEYETIETEHFIIRYEPGIDQVMVDMMPDRLERIHEIVSRRFGFEPDRKTVIEVMPNHKRFAVRITGMPWIHTVAACTGPVIAMEVPREGPPNQHLGLFDWPRVLQHEYTHTITLAQTANRIPHWLTEAAAVDMEPAPRDFDRCQMLADAFERGTLFDLDEIKWAFVRPKHPGDRGKAYAQSHWMVQYMTQRFGDSALVRLLERYFQGEREHEAIPNALGISREQFFEDFLIWAGEEIKSWGLAPSPTLEELTDELVQQDPDLMVQLAASRKARLDVIAKALSQQIGRPTTPRTRSLTGDSWPDLVRPPIEITQTQLNIWLDQHPEQPDLWELRIRRRLRDNDDLDDEAVQWLEKLAVLRPVDPYPHKQLARHWLTTDIPARAIPHLEYLDVREQKSPVFAIELAKLYRREGNADKAIIKINRALEINPYHAPTRELAASIAIEAARFKLAMMHIKALTLIEPDRPIHQKRLERIEQMVNSRG